MVMKRRVTRQPRVREVPAAFGVEADGPITFSRTVSAGDFKARCLTLMDEVRDSGGEYIITKHGTPVAKLVPVRVVRRPLRGSMKGTVTTHDDIVRPLGEAWDALEGWDDEP